MPPSFPPSSSSAHCAVHFHSSLPTPIRRLVGTVKAPFKQFLTLREAEALLGPGLEYAEENKDVPVWRPVLTYRRGASQPFRSPQPPQRVIPSPTPSARGTTHHSATPPYELFALYLVYVVSALLLLAEYVYEHAVGSALRGRLAAQPNLQFRPPSQVHRPCLPVRSSAKYAAPLRSSTLLRPHLA
ncbi:hypothetical protein C8R44DRAFT_891728 [Mycena epipterygia]|nr:hypothetical protein C8R44DRAFT_891728 [Mycena epipterygia]